MTHAMPRGLNLQLSFSPGSGSVYERERKESDVWLRKCVCCVCELTCGRRQGDVGGRGLCARKPSEAMGLHGVLSEGNSGCVHPTHEEDAICT